MTSVFKVAQAARVQKILDEIFSIYFVKPLQ